MKKKIVVLGSTGSIGTQALNVISAYPSEFELLALSCRSNIELLSRQAFEFTPKYVGVTGKTCGLELPKGVELVFGEDANAQLAMLNEADVVLIGISGIAGLFPLLSALNKGKTVALANKESIVCGYSLVKKALDEYGGRIIPVDSEHSAIFQCLNNGNSNEIDRLLITASGGPFREFSAEQLESVTPEQALNHPVWSMGSKVTIDSATLFNKGLEVIEACYLFNIPESKISVLIHPQSIVHSMVEYQDGTVIAQMSKPDMRLAIQYALSYPMRMPRRIERLSLPEIGKLTFFEGDGYPAIQLARDAVLAGDYLPIVYNAANEVAVELFIKQKIGFTDIRRVVEYCMESVSRVNINSINDVMLVDKEARKLANGEGKSWRY